MMRRRSRDGKAKPEQLLAPGNSEGGQQQRNFGRLSLVFLALISTLAVSTLLFDRWRRAYEPTSPLDIKFSQSSGFDLHPEEHALREPTTIKHEWNITTAERRPDGVLKRVYLVNDASPPTLEARSGDRLVIKVQNHLTDESVSIHWHGLSMRGANAMDGAAGITQLPIAPSESFTYDFTIEESQHGTFWWHAHDGVQRADGLYGGLVVHEPRGKVEAKEHLLLIGDWYARPSLEALEFFMHPGSFGNEAVPDGVLLNGAGIFNCSDAVPARPIDCKTRTLHDLPALELDRGERNILRVVNVGAIAGVNIAISGARLTVISVDGGFLVQGAAASSLGLLQPGERADVLVEQSVDEHKTPSLLTVSLETGPFKYRNPALTPIHQFPVSWTGNQQSRKGGYLPAEVENCDLQRLKALSAHSPALPDAADHTIVLYAITQKMAHLDNVPHGFINSTYWRSQSAPSAPLTSLTRDQWDDHQFVPHIEYIDRSPLWVDVVLNNLDEESHPFHIHGHDFYVLSTYTSTFNWGSYNPFRDSEPPGGAHDLVTALRKDTVLVPRRGYAVLRFRADNPGIWMFHCHVLWHQASGMAMALEVGT